MGHVRWMVGALLVASVVPVLAARAADLTAQEVTAQLFRATTANPIDLAGRDLSFLDLAELDFKGAKLNGANLYGSDLTQSNFTGSDLADARLDRSNVAGANFSSANLRAATLLTISAHLTVEPNPRDAPIFRGADLRDAYIAARMDGADFSNADLSGARIGRLVATWGSYRPRALLIAAKFNSAIMRRTDMSTAVLRFAEFQGADLQGANLRDCDLTHANFASANLAGADFTGADLDGAILTGAKGIAEAVGLATAKNVDKTAR